MSPTESSTSIDEIEAAARAAEAADSASRSENIGDLSGEPSKEKPTAVALDPAKAHAAMLAAVRVTIRRIDRRFAWDDPQDPEWYEATTTALELSLEMFFGKVMVSPPLALAFLLLTHVATNTVLKENEGVAPEGDPEWRPRTVGSA